MESDYRAHDDKLSEKCKRFHSEFSGGESIMKVGRGN